MLRLIIAQAATLVLALVANGNATAITFGGSWPTGTNTTSVSGVTFTTNGPDFGLKTVAGYTGVGVVGGPSGGNEIDVGESITAVFSSPSHIDYLSFDFLFNGPEFGDFQEVAGVTANGTLYTLGTTAFDDIAVWSGAGTVSNVSLADGSHAGVWRIEDPFGGALVTRLEFTAITSSVCTPGLSCSNQSDYSLGGMEFSPVLEPGTISPVPEPATFLLLGAGLLGLTALRRRTC